MVTWKRPATSSSWGCGMFRTIRSCTTWPAFSSANIPRHPASLPTS